MGPRSPIQLVPPTKGGNLLPLSRRLEFEGVAVCIPSRTWTPSNFAPVSLPARPGFLFDSCFGLNRRALQHKPDLAPGLFIAAGGAIGSLPFKAAQWSISQPTTNAPGININKKPIATYFTGHPWRHLRGRNG